MDLLVVEDDVVLGKALVKGLTEAGHVCIWTQNGFEAVERCKNQLFDIAVLDLLLPDLHGLEVLREFRIHQPSLAVLILSALGTVEERVHGLNSGADDYLVKPFAFAEWIEAVAMNFGKIKSTFRSLRFRLMLLNAIVVLLASMGTLVGLRAGMKFALVHELSDLDLSSHRSVATGWLAE